MAGSAAIRLEIEKMSREAVMRTLRASHRRFEKRQKLLRVTRQAGEGRHHVSVGVEDRVVGNSDGLELGFLEPLVLFRFRVGAIRIELYQHEVDEGCRDLRPGEHVGFHPMAVGARVCR